ncbi:MAG: dihydrofolate reductase [Candidatus Paceibacterota bacterium]
MRTTFSIVVAMDHNRVIGNNNTLPWQIPSDLRHFRSLTTGHAVVMGRKTCESIVKKLGEPLPRRTNIVLTRQKNFRIRGCIVVHSIEALDRLGFEHVFVIGGMEIYNLLLPYAERVHLTYVDAQVEGSAVFPEVEVSVWEHVSTQIPKQTSGDQYPVSFVEYRRRP